MEKKHSPLLYLVLFFVALGFIGFVMRSKTLNTNFIKSDDSNASIEESLGKDTIQKIASDADFISLMGEGRNSTFRSGAMLSEGMMLKSTMPAPGAAAGDVAVQRTSGTNVQVFGIDEPDIVKTDNATIFYSKDIQYGYINDFVPSSKMGMESSFPPDRMMPPIYNPKKEIIAVGAVPPSQMNLQGSIPQNGEMLISGNTLVVFTNDDTNGALRLIGYSIENARSPKKLWELPFSMRAQKVAARLYKKSIYLVTSTSPTMPRPCPIPLIEGKTGVSVNCTDIYMPSSRPSSDTVFSALQINPQTGAVEKKLSFIGQAGQSTLYMSQNSLYLSYQSQVSSVEMMSQFISENKGTFPRYLEDKIGRLGEYDLTESTKEIEMNTLLSQYINGIEDGGRLKLENQITNTFKRFLEKHKRSFEYVGIIKINSDDLTIQASGKVPGTVLNQYSFDEWKGDLRVATTIGGGNPFYMFAGNNSANQVSDVYVLGNDMKIKGSVKDLGKTERIYSVRFIADRGYVVTFRQTDPFYVLDLSNGSAPQLKGELKIPGYSSYLHPLDTHLILGIGRENQVKLSLFDVSDPTKPTEVDRYELSGEYWSEAMDNPHAFLQDEKYKVFFLPGSRGGYIFSYEGNRLNMTKAIETNAVKRGLYINDVFYIVSDSGIAAFKEGTWQKVGEYTFKKDLEREQVGVDSGGSVQFPLREGLPMEVVGQSGPTPIPM